MDLKYEIEVLKENIPEVQYKAGLIEYDLTTFNNKVNELVAQIKTEIVTRDTIKDYKDLKATLNKFSKEINDEKIKIVREFTAPVDAFQEEVKSNLALIKDAISSIDTQLKDFEKQELELLKEEYEAMWDELGIANNIPFIRIEDRRWYLKSATKAKVKNEMMNLIDKFNKDIELIKISVDNEEEANAVIKKYYASLDVNKELGEYRSWKNTIKAEPVIVERVVEKVVETTTPKNDEKPVETKLEPKNEEMEAASLFDMANEIQEVADIFPEETVNADSGLTMPPMKDVTLSFTAPVTVIDEIENILNKYGIEYFKC